MVRTLSRARALYSPGRAGCHASFASRSRATLPRTSGPLTFASGPRGGRWVRRRCSACRRCPGCSDAVTSVVTEQLDDSRLDNLYRMGVDEISYRKATAT
jgi:predicted RecB family nuclease